MQIWPELKVTSKEVLPVSWILPILNHMILHRLEDGFYWDLARMIDF